MILTLATLTLLAAPLLGMIPKERMAGTPLCWSVILFHRECAGCGLTRSFASIGRGSLTDANAFNPLGPILYGWAAAIIGIRAGRLARPSRYWAAVDTAFACAVVIVLVTRLVLFYFG